MKVIFSSLPIAQQRMFDIEDEKNKTLEALVIAKQIQKYCGVLPGYFFFCEDNGARIGTANYFINGKIVTKSEMRNINPEYAALMEQNGYSKAAILASGEEILPFFDDYNLTVN